MHPFALFVEGGLHVAAPGLGGGGRLVHGGAQVGECGLGRVEGVAIDELRTLLI
jgi:hypothetical protein